MYNRSMRQDLELIKLLFLSACPSSRAAKARQAGKKDKALIPLRGTRHATGSRNVAAQDPKPCNAHRQAAFYRLSKSGLAFSPLHLKGGKTEGST